MSVEENRELERRFIEEVINQQNLAAADELVAEDVVELDPFPGQQPGREGLKGVLGMLFAAFPDQKWTIEELIAEGDKVVNRFTWRGLRGVVLIGVTFWVSLPPVIR